MNPLYNDTCYNSKIRYYVNSVCTKISRSCNFVIDNPILFFGKTRFVYLLESPRRVDSNKYTKRMIHKKMFENIRYSCFRWVHIKFLYNNNFDLTINSLVTNRMVITRVLCIYTVDILVCLWSLAISKQLPILLLFCSVT